MPAVSAAVSRPAGTGVVVGSTQYRSIEVSFVAGRPPRIEILRLSASGHRAGSVLLHTDAFEPARRALAAALEGRRTSLKYEFARGVMHFTTEPNEIRIAVVDHGQAQHGRDTILRGAELTFLSEALYLARHGCPQ